MTATAGVVRQERPALHVVGNQAKCVVRCSLYGQSDKCWRCPIPRGDGRAVCPRCGGILYPFGHGEKHGNGRARWACDNRTCGVTISFPMGDPDAEAEQAMAEEEDRRWLEAKRRRERRQRAKPRTQAGITGLECPLSVRQRAD